MTSTERLINADVPFNLKHALIYTWKTHACYRNFDVKGPNFAFEKDYFRINFGKPSQ